MGQGAVLVVLGFGLATALGACAGGGAEPSATKPGTEATPVVCDPLAPRPIALAAIVGVGMDTDGTLYVDAANGVFVSSGDELVRQHVTGGGQSGSTEYLFSFEPAGDSAHAQTLLVETDTGGAATAMALGPPGSRAFLDQPDPGTTPLELVAPTRVSQLTLVNTPNLISYVGDVENGEVVFATVPLNLDPKSESGGLSIFYGPPENVQERKITDFQQSLSNTGTVTFLVGTGSFVLAFGTVPRSDNPLGEFTLNGLTTASGDELAVTLRSPTPTALPPELSFTCLL